MQYSRLWTKLREVGIDNEMVNYVISLYLITSALLTNNKIWTHYSPNHRL